MRQTTFSQRPKIEKERERREWQIKREEEKEIEGENHPITLDRWRRQPSPQLNLKQQYFGEGQLPSRDTYASVDYAWKAQSAHLRQTPQTWGLHFIGAAPKKQSTGAFLSCLAPMRSSGMPLKTLNMKIIMGIAFLSFYANCSPFSDFFAYFFSRNQEKWDLINSLWLLNYMYE